MIYNELIKELKSGKLRNAYILYGEDEGFIKESIDRIKEISGISEGDIFNFVRLDGQKVSFSDMENAIFTLPFMGGKKLVEIFRCDFFSGSSSIESWNEKINLIREFCENPPEDTILVVYYILDQDKKDTKIKQLDNTAHKTMSAVVKMPQIKKDNIDEFIRDYFSEKGLEIPRPIIVYIKDSFEGSIFQLEKNLDKLYAYTIGRTITKQDVNLQIIKSGTRSKYDLMDMIVEGKGKDALELYNDLIFKRTDPAEILETIGTRVREVYNYKVRLLSGFTQQQIMKDLNERFTWLVDKKCRMYRNVPLERIKKMTDYLIESEERFKSTGTDREREIELLILALCGA